MLKVIKKTLLANGKPAFEWVGQSGIREFSIEIESDVSCHRESPQTPLALISQNTGEVRHNAEFDLCNLNYYKGSEGKIPQFAHAGMQNLTPVPTLESMVGLMPNGLYESSLDLLEGIVKVLRKRLTSDSESTAPKNLLNK